MCRVLLLAWPCWNRVAFTPWKPPPCRAEKTLNCCICFCRILISHEGPVWAIERKGDFLVSGSSDKTVSECFVVVICSFVVCLISINCHCSVNLNKSLFFIIARQYWHGVYGVIKASEILLGLFLAFSLILGAFSYWKLKQIQALKWGHFYLWFWKQTCSFSG